MVKTLFTNPAFYGTIFIFLLMFIPFAKIIPDRRRNKIIACICVVIASFGIASLFFIGQIEETERWNSGICINCGGVYELSGISKQPITKFCYTCGTCGRTEKFPNLME